MWCKLCDSNDLFWFQQMPSFFIKWKRFNGIVQLVNLRPWIPLVGPNGIGQTPELELNSERQSSKSEGSDKAPRTLGREGVSTEDDISNFHNYKVFARDRTAITMRDTFLMDWWVSIDHSYVICSQQITQCTSKKIFNVKISLMKIHCVKSSVNLFKQCGCALCIDCLYAYQRYTLTGCFIMYIS